jgi:hypothetical protein
MGPAFNEQADRTQAAWQRVANLEAGRRAGDDGTAGPKTLQQQYDYMPMGEHPWQPKMIIPKWTPEPTYAGSTPDSRALAMANAQKRAEMRANGEDPAMLAYGPNTIDSRPEAYSNDPLPGNRGARIRSTTEMLAGNDRFAAHMARVDKMNGVGQYASQEDRRAAQTRNAEDRVAWRREGLTPTQNQVMRDVRAGKPLTVTQYVAAGGTNPAVIAGLSKTEETAATLAGTKYVADQQFAGHKVASETQLGVADKQNIGVTYKTKSEERIAELQRQGATDDQIRKETGMSLRQLADHKNSIELQNIEQTGRKNVAQIMADKNKAAIDIALQKEYETADAKWIADYLAQKTPAERAAYKANVRRPTNPSRATTAAADEEAIDNGDGTFAVGGITYRKPTK